MAVDTIFNEWLRWRQKCPVYLILEADNWCTYLTDGNVRQGFDYIDDKAGQKLRKDDSSTSESAARQEYSNDDRVEVSQVDPGNGRRLCMIKDHRFTHSGLHSGRSDSE